MLLPSEEDLRGLLTSGTGGATAGDTEPRKKEFRSQTKLGSKALGIERFLLSPGSRAPV